MEQKLIQKTKIYEDQFDFMPGRSALEVIFSLRQLMEKIERRERSAYGLYRPRKSL